MQKIRDFLWKYLGMTLDREKLLVLGLVVLSLVGTIVLGILFGVTGNPLFRVLGFFAAIPAVLIALGGSYKTLDWSLSDKNGRRNIEEEMTLNQLKRRARDKHYER